MEIKINRLYNCDCFTGLRLMADNSVDLTVTSPPYDELRTYGKTLEWNFEIFQKVAKELYRVTKPGGVLVWVVGDATIDGNETGTSARQKLYFRDECGFKLHDTMIYEKNGSSRPSKKNSKRYSQIFEYMFVFVKGEIRQDIKLIADKYNKWAGWSKWGRNTTFDVDGNLVEVKKNQPIISEYSIRNNIWKYSVSFNDKTGHPAVFPEKLAEDHILSWSVEGDLVLDPFMGSGTTAKMAMLNKRNYIGFEKNKEYYEKSLERIAKYEGQVNNNVNTIDLQTYYEDEDTNEIVTETDTYQYSTNEDKEFEGKKKLWDKYVKKLEDYFNEQSLGTLKNLNFIFKSKSNDERVKKINGIDETDYESVINEIKRLETVLNSFTPSQPSQVPKENITISEEEKTNTFITKLPDENTDIKLDETYFKKLLTKTFEENENVFVDYFDNFLKEYLAKYYRIPRLTDEMVRVNEEAKKAKQLEEAKKKYPIQMVELREQDFVEKKTRKRKTNESEIKYKNDENIEVHENVFKPIESVETTFEVNEDGSTESIVNNTDDDLPFVLSEEEHQRILGNPLGDIVDGKSEYIEPVVKIKRPRGRPRKNPIINE